MFGGGSAHPRPACRTCGSWGPLYDGLCLQHVPIEGLFAKKPRTGTGAFSFGPAEPDKYCFYCSRKKEEGIPWSHSIYGTCQACYDAKEQAPPTIRNPTPVEWGTFTYGPPEPRRARVAWPKAPCTPSDHRWFYLSEVNLPDSMAFAPVPAYAVHRDEFTSSLVCVRCGEKKECDPEEAMELTLKKATRVL